MASGTLAFKHIRTFIIVIPKSLDLVSSFEYPFTRPFDDNYDTDPYIVYQFIAIKTRIRKRSTDKFAREIFSTFMKERSGLTIYKFSATYFINELQIKESAKRKVREFVGK
jgi:hypothetical protein